MRDSIVYNKAFKFSVKIINLYKSLSAGKSEYVMSKQLLRAGTSIGANIKEALNAQTKKDFISKMHIALKESAETEYWIDLLKETEYMDDYVSKLLLEDLTEIIKLLNSIIKTSKMNISLTDK